MKTRYTVALSMIVGTALGGAAIQGVHAQLSAKKAYTVSELETLDAAANAFVPKVQAAQQAAGGRNLKTGGGKVVALEGTAPKRVAITEWDSLEKAQAFYTSKAWNDLAPERDKALKTIRRYVVETVN